MDCVAEAVELATAHIKSIPVCVLTNCQIGPEEEGKLHRTRIGKQLMDRVAEAAKLDLRKRANFFVFGPIRGQPQPKNPSYERRSPPKLQDQMIIHFVTQNPSPNKENRKKNKAPHRIGFTRNWKIMSHSRENRWPNHTRSSDQP
jgi:hypothetical protein